MKLFYNRLSPYARKILVLLHELNCLDIVEFVDVTGSPTDPGSLPVSENPLGKIPTLSGTPYGPLYDSRVISRYLDNYTNGNMYPALPDLWETLVLESTSDGIMDAAVLMVYEVRCRPESIQSNEWIKGQWQKIYRALHRIEDRLIPDLETKILMGDISLGCALGYLDFRHSNRDWRTQHPKLAVWYKQFSKRKSMQETLPELLQ